MNKITEIYKNRKAPVFSFEFFPPKTPEGEEKLFKTIQNLSALDPGFVSVTYGAGGSTREKTLEISRKIKNNFSFPPMCHFTCVGASRDEIRNTLREIELAGIVNLIALRGDPPQGQGKFHKTEDGFSNATELITFIKKEGFGFSIGGGCYPEKHPDSISMEEEIINLKKKVDAGAEFLISQLFFVNSVFDQFTEKVIAANVHVPVVPGIMPITEFKQIDRFRQMAGCEIPQSLISSLEKVKDDQVEFLKRSLDFTVSQCEVLLKSGAIGIHFYTLNQSKATIEIVSKLQGKSIG
ncbi:MAG: methylenetetrahydrofolate reductase [NAD(P)H] [Leptospira sp.]|nr:methylenetetrahydrofolate reductase [NAD(P)H] [Leptospira sp.]